MAVIALNWELGADLGHLGRLLPIARRLRDAGHRPVLILRDLSRIEQLLGDERIDYLQAPLWLPSPAGLPPDLNFSETLCRFGYLQPAGLLGMCRAWRALWALVRPDLLVFDLAPTAALAARGLGVPCVSVNDGFTAPPQITPLPPYRFWTSHAGQESRLREVERRIVLVANVVLQRLDAPQIHRVSELFDLDRVFICTQLELDVYGASTRRREEHVGPVADLDRGAPPEWPAGEDPRVFAYLKPDTGHFAAVMDAMAASDGRYLVFAPGIGEASLRRYGSERVRIGTAPFRLREVLRDCTAVISHGGGMTESVLAHGKPLLLLPQQMEQLMTSVRVSELGAAVFLATDGNPAELPKLLERLLRDASLRRAAAAIAAKVGAKRSRAALDIVADACLEMVGEGGALRG